MWVSQRAIWQLDPDRPPDHPRHLYGPFMPGTTNASRILMRDRALDSQSGPRGTCEVIIMLDFLMVAYGVGFFAATILYVLACERM